MSLVFHHLSPSSGADPDISPKTVTRRRQVGRLYTNHWGYTVNKNCSPFLVSHFIILFVYYSSMYLVLNCQPPFTVYLFILSFPLLSHLKSVALTSTTKSLNNPFRNEHIEVPSLDVLYPSFVTSIYGALITHFPRLRLRTPDTRSLRSSGHTLLLPPLPFPIRISYPSSTLGGPRPHDPIRPSNLHPTLFLLQLLLRSMTRRPAHLDGSHSVPPSCHLLLFASQVQTYTI